MPTYEYVCRACGHRFEIKQAFTEDSLTICPSCGGELRKVFGAPAISFKGSGFYATDSRKGTPSAGEKKPSEGAKETAKEATTSSEGGAKDTGSTPTEKTEKAKTADAPKKAAKKP